MTEESEEWVFTVKSQEVIQYRDFTALYLVQTSRHSGTPLRKMIEQQMHKAVPTDLPDTTRYIFEDGSWIELYEGIAPATPRYGTGIGQFDD